MTFDEFTKLLLSHELEPAQRSSLLAYTIIKPLRIIHSSTQERAVDNTWTIFEWTPATYAWKRLKGSVDVPSLETCLDPLVAEELNNLLSVAIIMGYTRKNHSSRNETIFIVNTNP